MNRSLASELLRKTLDEQNLKDWHIRLIADLTKPFLGLCSYKDKCIILNALHVDTHPDIEVIDTIKHEVAHALVGSAHGHDDVWKQKAVELGALPQACATMSLSLDAIDAIRSGANLEVTYTEKVTVERIPKYTVTRLQDKCTTCGKVFKEKSRNEVKTSKGYMIVITGECNHVIFRQADSQSPFEDIVFDIPTNGADVCKDKHDWSLPVETKYKITCGKCGAKRLYPFQIEDCRKIEKADGIQGIFNDQRTGKTMEALGYLKFHEEDAWPFLWVTKSGIKFQHVKEIIRVLGKKAFPQVIRTGKETLIPGMNCICSYDIFRRLDLKMFEEHGFKMLVLDECQAIKNPDSSRTQCIRKIKQHIPKFLPLSGTPWKNRGSEFFVALNLLDPKRFYSYEHFKRQWVDTYWDGNKEKEGGIRNPKKFREFVQDLVIRRERSEVLPELPQVNRTRMLCEIPEHARKVYNEEAQNIANIVNQAIIDGTEDSMSFATHREINASIMVMKQIVGIAKVDTTVEYVKEFLEDNEDNIIIFVHHKECGKQIMAQLTEHCKAEGLAAPLQLSASLDASQRFVVQTAFNEGNDPLNGKPYRVLVASTLASGEGLNLNKRCATVIMHERQWNPPNEVQAEDRIAGIGQSAQHLSAVYVHANDSVDTDLDGIVERKRRHFHNSMNKGEIMQWNEADLTKEMINAIVNRITNKGKAA